MAPSILERRADRDAKRAADPYALTPAVRAALAYIAITGNTPKGAHVDTWVAALYYAEQPKPPSLRAAYVVPEENAQHYLETPLWKAHAALRAAGFSFRGPVRGPNLRIGKNLRYERVDDSGNGFEAEVTPQGYLIGTVVRGFLSKMGQGRTECVRASQAGTLPNLFSRSA